MIPVSNKLKQTFIKDNGSSIQLYDEPYFSERIDASGLHYAYSRFCDMIETTFHNNEGEFLSYREDLKNRMINYIKSSETFKALNSDDMNTYARRTQKMLPDNISTGDIYKDCYVGKNFISIDMSKANFTAMVYYGNLKGCPFNACDYSWKSFMSKFTTNPYFAESKYLRQVVFGNCNPKRQVTFEKYMMADLFDGLSLQSPDTQILKTSLTKCNNDELIFAADDKMSNSVIDSLYPAITQTLMSPKPDCFENNILSFLPIKVGIYKLGKVMGTKAYIKQTIDVSRINVRDNGQYLPPAEEVVCANPVESLFIQRFLRNEPIKDSDLAFYSQYGPAKLLIAPEISISYEKQNTPGKGKEGIGATQENNSDELSEEERDD